MSPHDPDRDAADVAGPGPRWGRWVLAALVVASIAVGWHAWSIYDRRVVCGEASLNVRKIADGVVAWTHGDGDSPAGRPLPSSVGPTPDRWPRCIDDRAQQIEGDWSDPTWVALGFVPDGPTYYRYSFTVDPADPHRFTVRALGDLDCNGDLSTFERIGRVDPDTAAVEFESYREVDRAE